MGHAGYIACALLLLCPLALSRHDDDFAFDSDEFQLDLNVNHSEIAKNGLRRLWGVPDTSAYVRHLFRMEIPKEAFSGEVSTYKVRSENGRHLPSWLAVDTKHGLISGIPQHQDIGVHHFTVTAHGRTHGLTATDSFTIEVKKSEDKPHSKYGTCSVGEKRLVLCIMIDGALHQITPRQRIRALMELASFMALDGDEFWMEPYKPSSLQSVLTSGVGTTTRRRGDATTAIYFNVGCGDELWPRHRVLVGGLREQARDGTLANTLRLPVLGWRLGAVAAPRAKRQTQPIDDGSGTYDTYDGEDDQDDYSGYSEADEEEDYGTGDAGGLDGTNVYPAVVEPPSPPAPPAPPAPSPSPHPHRHHHGEPSPDVPDLSDYTQQPPHTTTDVFQTETAASPTTTTSTTTTTTSPPVTLPPPSPPPASTAAATESPAPTITAAPDTTEPSTNTYVTEGEKVQITPYSESASEASNVNYSRIMPFESLPNVPRKLGGHSPVVIVPEDFATTPEPETQTVIIRASNELPPMSSSEAPTPSSPQPSSTEETILWTPITPATSTSMTTPAPVVVSQTTMVLTVPTTPATTTSTVAPTTTQEAETTIEEVTKQDPSISTERSSTIIGQTTETIILPMPVNQPPSLKHHMKKLAVTAGKAFKYIIPEDLFTDPEEGSNLTFTMYGADKTNLSSWIQFIPSEREVYGLPLESHVSRWPFIVEARDSEGLVARGPLDVTVQQHKSGRTISHQFLLQFKLNRTYTKAIDWQIRALEGIVNLFKGSGWRDTDADQLTVLNATQNGDLYEFVWTNDTLPKDGACSTDAVKRLMRIMESETEPGSPSPDLIRAMAPELKVSAVRWQGVGRCAQLIPATKSPADYPPVSRNQVDHLTATVGHLLVYKVPEDTFYDPEEDNTRNLHLSLRYSDRSELPAGHWLQFDANNQEFYGLPGPGDEAAVTYQLIAEDSAKNSAYDSLIVEVVKAPAIKPTVEFQMTMEYPFPLLAYNANNKRKVVEKLAELFGQTDTENIRIQSITDNPTTIIWYNTSLPMDRCPKREIEELRKMIIVDNRDNRGTVGGALRENVDHVFDKDFKVMAIRLIPQGLCAEQSTKTIKQPTEYAPGNTQGSKTSSESGYTEYLVTFVIPAVVIVCMILVAGIIACVLYKRRRTGKMSVGDEEERQAFRSKGIPVIFQDELEERGDAEPAHKSPVIMRDEKPPLLPPAPDYRGSSGEAPYRPPPPFAASRTPPRPKATPTYRKPPPYVPP